MDVDVENHAHHHHTGHRWVDLTVAFSALFVSMVSVAIAVHHGHTMEKLVEANSWPSLQIYDSDADAQGGKRIRLTIRNVGVGPARIGQFTLRYDGKPVRDSHELLRLCCRTDEPHPTYWTSQVLGRVVPARDAIDFIDMPLRDDNAETVNQLDAARLKLSMSVCYCSVFDECWIAHSDLAAPQRTESCEVLDGPAYNDGERPAEAAAATVPAS